MNIRRLSATALSISLLTLFITTVSGQNQDPSGSNSAPVRTTTRSDADIQKCIQGKLAGSEKLRDQDFTVNVSNSEAIFTGTARNAGSKGAVTRIGQSCGAVKVVNNITAPAIPRPAKPTTKVEGRTSL